MHVQWNEPPITDSPIRGQTIIIRSTWKVHGKSASEEVYTMGLNTYSVHVYYSIPSIPLSL